MHKSNESLTGCISLKERFGHNSVLAAALCPVAQFVLSTILWTPSEITVIYTQSAVFITPGLHVRTDGLCPEVELHLSLCLWTTNYKTVTVPDSCSC